MPGSEARYVVKHCKETFFGDLNIENKKYFKLRQILQSYLAFTVTVEFEVDIPVERRNVGHSLQLPILLAEAVDGDDRITNLRCN